MAHVILERRVTITAHIQIQVTLHMGSRPLCSCCQLNALKIFETQQACHQPPLGFMVGHIGGQMFVFQTVSGFQLERIIVTIQILQGCFRLNTVFGGF